MDTHKVTQEYRLNKWIKIISECKSSGQNVLTWCKNNDIRTNSYYYWLRKIRAAACETLAKENTENQIVPLDISLDSSSFSTELGHVPLEKNNPDIIIHVGSDIVEINNTASPILIENIIKALKNVR